MTVMFFIFAALAVLGGLGVIIAKNPLHSALSLIGTMVSIAVIYILLHADFIAALQIAVYAGAVMMLIIFTIFLVDMGPGTNDKRTNSLGILGLIVGGLVFIAIALFVRMPTGGKGEMTQAMLEKTGTVQYIAEQLFTNYLLPFELASILLLVGLVGAVALAKKKL